MTIPPSVLLVGGCGYIGSYIYSQLVKEGISPKVCDHLSRGNPLNIPVMECDYASLTPESLAAYSAVIWFAGHSSVQQSVSDPQGALTNNCLNLLEFARKLKSSTRLIYASSGSLYSETVGTQLSPSRETDLVHIPYKNAYDISKFAFDYLAENFLTNFYALRMGTVSGFSPNLRTELLFNAMSIAAATSGKVNLKNRDAFRTLLYIDDLWLLVKQLLTSGAEPGVYNVGSVSGTIESFAQQIASAWGAEVVDQGSSETYSFLLSTERMDFLLPHGRSVLSVAERSLEFIRQYRQFNEI